MGSMRYPTLLTLALLSPAALADFEYPNFAGALNLKRNGDCTLVGNFAHINTNSWNMGSMWYRFRQNVADGFDTQFEFEITGQSEGMAFVIQNDSTSAMGFCGEAMGFGANSSTQCPTAGASELVQAVVIELDTAFNLATADPDGNHVSVHAHLNNGKLQDHGNSLGTSSNIPTLDDGAVHTMRVVYQVPTLEIYIDDLATPALVVTVDLAAQIQLTGGTDAYVGFTSGTYGLDSIHRVRSWSFFEQSKFVGSPNQLSVSAGGTQNWTIDAGPANAGLTYLVLGSATGTAPGTTVSGYPLRLNVDTYTLYTLKSPNTIVLQNSLGLLDGAGQATGAFNVPMGADPSLVGLKLDHAFVVIELIPGVILHAVSTSNTLQVELVP